MPEFNNKDLSSDYEKILTYGMPLFVSKDYDSNLDYRYILVVADTSYFYYSRFDRDSDYDLFKQDITDRLNALHF
jgi:hypothetical protein